MHFYFFPSASEKMSPDELTELSSWNKVEIGKNKSQLSKTYE